MFTLYHYPVSPFSRKVRVVLAEKELPFEMIQENYWQRRREFLAMNPASQVPVLVDGEGRSFAESTAICEYVEDVHPKHSLIGNNPQEKAEVRRIAGWFNNKFYYEVTKYLLEEKVFKYLRKQGQPSTEVIRAGKNNMLYHLDYIAHLTKDRKWLAGEQFSLADITAASHLSALDYLGDVPWDYDKQVKDWYSLVKSRPSFRPLLSDRIAGFNPPSYYDNLDF